VIQIKICTRHRPIPIWYRRLGILPRLHVTRKFGELANLTSSSFTKHLFHFSPHGREALILCFEQVGVIVQTQPVRIPDSLISS